MQNYTRVPRDRQALATAMQQHDGLVHAVIRREGGGNLSYTEALQAGRIGLWRALVGYDLTRGTAFSTYAWVAIRRHIHRRAQDLQRERAAARRPGAPGRQSGGDSRDPAQQVATAQLHQELQALVDRLPAPLGEIIRRRYGLDGALPATLRALGAEQGVSREWIRQLQLTALAWLRHPAHSARVRALLDLNTPAAYRQALAQNAALRRARRAP